MSVSLRYKRRCANNMKNAYAFVSSDGYFCQILTKYEFSRQSFVEVSNIKSGQNHPVVLVNH